MHVHSQIFLIFTELDSFLVCVLCVYDKQSEIQILCGVFKKNIGGDPLNPNLKYLLDVAHLLGELNI